MQVKTVLPIIVPEDIACSFKGLVPHKCQSTIGSQSEKMWYV